MGVYIDSHLNWKIHIDYVSMKIKRSIGLLSKLRYFVSRKVRNNLYYALLHPFCIYGLVTWGNTYEATILPLFILQKKLVRIMTFSKFDDNSSPLFKSLRIVKLFDLVSIQTAIFMYNFHHSLLPSVFDSFFVDVSKVHKYNTRLDSNQSYYLPRARTNYGIFYIRFQGPSAWNALNDSIKSLSLAEFKEILKQNVFPY